MQAWRGGSVEGVKAFGEALAREKGMDAIRLYTNEQMTENIAF